MEFLTFGISPCPNDTFIFGALKLGLVNIGEDKGMRFILRDVEELNRLALEGSCDVIKTSVAAYGRVRDRYVLLDSGGALGRGVGPLVVAKDPISLEANDELLVAIPGKLTTAYLLFKMAYPSFSGRIIEMRYDEIFDAVESQEVDAGVVIHEGRFTYGERGLIRLMDLGTWWEENTSLPVPLGCILARKDLGEPLIHSIEDAIRESLEFARKDPTCIWDFVKTNAQEMDEEVIYKHIQTFVTEFSISLGEEGRKAIEELVSCI